MALTRAAAALLATVLAAGGSAAGPAPSPLVQDAPDAASADVWIFSGELGNRETYSGTLVEGAGDARFELKLGNGATCDGEETGAGAVVRLPDMRCSDERTTHVLFVPQGADVLKVFGRVGDERFASDAHLLAP